MKHAQPLPVAARHSPPAIALAAVCVCGCAFSLAAAPPARAQGADEAVQQVVITASRHALPVLDAPAAMGVVTEQQIEARGADNLLDAVRGQPGLSIQGRAVHGRKVIAMRGLDSRHTLFLVDGLRISASDGTVGASDFQYDWLETADIQRIEVLRGPLSVLYGSEALGGVVQVITRPVGERWEGHWRAEASHADGERGGDGWRGLLSVGGPLTRPGAGGGRWFARLGAAASEREAVASSVDPLISALEGRRKREGWGQIGWRNARGDQLTLQTRYGDEHRRADARERSGRRRYHVTVNDLWRSATALDWLSHWGSDAAPVETRVRLYRTDLSVRNLRTEGVTENLPQTLTDDVLDAQARIERGAHALTLGTELRRETLKDSGLPDGRDSARHLAGYLQEEWTPRPDLTVTGGLRLDHHSQFGSQWSPRLYAVYRPAPHWVIKGGASHGFKAPNLKQIQPVARAEGPNTVIGHADLKPERSHSLELGAGWQRGDWQFSAMAFAQRVRDLIELNLIAAGSVPGIGTYEYANIASARMSGLELSGAMPLGRQWQLGAQYTYLEARDGDGARLQRRPRHSGGVQLDWHSGPWQAGVALEHTGRQLLPSGSTPVAVGDVTLASAHVQRTLAKGLKLSLGVTNLTGVDLIDRSALYTQAEAPRTWRIALQQRW